VKSREKLKVEEYWNSGLSLKVEVKDFKEADRFLFRFSSSRLRDLARVAGVEFVKISRAAFDSQKDPFDDSSWKASVKRKSGGSTLRDTSRPMRSVTSRAEWNSALVGSHLVYARMYQEGGRTGRGGSVEILLRRYLNQDKSGAESFMNTPLRYGGFSRDY